ncbi:uncharacterized protein LOC127708772 isoform X9 [Mytilus californianus]|uniref:uncharacterized protein LOC127708772 isoform X9 n=1 Tax=Mytilus californianus TaxID=6549 RepID=UPI0022486C7A|nr:uncharacterized protein LOC127708772 isoform X9 [Mytilus californianus]
METIWLQRSSGEVPWGFRLQGGREFAQPLSVQKVTPGSVAGNVLVPGDIVLKIGNNNVTNVSHNEGQDLIRYSGDLLQLTIKRCPRVAASAPVSPTPMSQYNQYCTQSESPSSFRSLSPVSDNYPMYQQGYPYQQRMYPDERDSPRQFASLPRHAGGYRNYQDQYEPQQPRREEYSTQTMPKPTPYRPNAGFQQPYSQMRNANENYGPGYNTSPYSREQQQQVMYDPYQPDPYQNRSPGPNFSPGPPGYGIAPPTYGETQQRRGSNTSGPSYSRQTSSNMYQNQNVPSYDSQPGNNGYYVNSNYNESQSPYQRQDSGIRSYNGYEHQRPDDNQQRSYQSNDTSLQRQTSTGYQRQPSYEQHPQVHDGRQVVQPPSEEPTGDQQRVPDAVLNTMMKQQGSGQPKPFAYFTGGIDLKEFKKRNRPPPKVMPKGYKGPTVDEEAEVAYSKPKPVKNPPQQGPYKHVQYNNPINVYSKDNAEQQLRTQSQGSVTAVSGRRTRRHSESSTPQFNYIVPMRTIRMPDKPAADIENSAVYKMIKESESSGKSSVLLTPDREGPQRKQGLSFLLLQTLYDNEMEENKTETNTECAPRQKHPPRDPLLRHNSIDDEMTFSGLNKKTDIPSKAFRKLTRISNQDDTELNGQQQYQQDAYDKYRDDDEEESSIGKYEQGSIRYTGKHIPSPSFRVLQRLAKCQDDDQPAAEPIKQQRDEDDLPSDEDDGLPDTLSGEELTNKRYMGGHIPSRSFKYLQMSVGDTGAQNGSVEQSREATPPQRTPAGTGRTLKIITRSTAVKPQQQQEDTPSTDF